MYKSNFIKKRPQYRCFPVNFAKFFENTFCCRTPPVAASVGDTRIKKENQRVSVIKLF